MLIKRAAAGFSVSWHHDLVIRIAPGVVLITMIRVAHRIVSHMAAIVCGSTANELHHRHLALESELFVSKCTQQHFLDSGQSKMGRLM